MSKLQYGTEVLSIINTGILEHGGRFERQLNDFGSHINQVDKHFPDLDNPFIIYAHFGVELMMGLSCFEQQWFKAISDYKPVAIVRHHSHNIQDPFFQDNSTPIYPSLGDFAFLRKGNPSSLGCVVIIDTNVPNKSVIIYVKYNNNYLHITNIENVDCTQLPSSGRNFSQSEIEWLSCRLRSEYRLSVFGSLKRVAKIIMRRERKDELLETISDHFIQPRLISEIMSKLI